jgi:hypothetical protein
MECFYGDLLLLIVKSIDYDDGDELPMLNASSVCRDVDVLDAFFDEYQNSVESSVSFLVYIFIYLFILRFFIFY